MSYCIPSDRQIKRALRKVLEKAHTVQSQTMLRELVTEELNQGEKKFGLSGERLRKIAVAVDFVALEIHSREGDVRKFLSNCPVCGMPLERVRNLTIWGGVVTIEFRCGTCGYWTGKKRRIPSRYVFHYTRV